MIQLQVLSYILQTRSMDIVENNYLSEEYFWEYKDEIQFIYDHVRDYGNVPDKATFLAKFSDIDLVEVNETERYLVDTIREEYLFSKSVPILEHAADLLKVDSNAAAEYIASQADILQPSYSMESSDITQQSDRFSQYKEHKENGDKWFFESGFKELDDIIHGIQREEEFLVIVARTNQGKSWILEKMCAHVWQTGFNVGYISPEMGATSIGYRFDTLMGHFSNKDLMCGGNGIDEEEYKAYLEDLKKHENRFMVATPTDFRGPLTVSKLRRWIRQYKLDLVAIDGIKYLSDERGRKNDNMTTSLTNISEDLMALSVEMHVPVLVVVQANRSGVVNDEDEGTPELESIRDSDGISHNASKVLSIRNKKDNTLEIGIKKQRFGAVGGKVCYHWDINTGTFTYMPQEEKRDRPRQDRPSEKRGVDMF